MYNVNNYLTFVDNVTKFTKIICDKKISLSLIIFTKLDSHNV